MKRLSDEECLTKLLQMGFDVPPIVLKSWPRKAYDLKRVRVEAFIGGTVRQAVPEFLKPFHLSQNRPTAWWMREKEEQERSRKL